MRGNAAKNMALGGVMASLAVVIMCLGGLIPVATFVCPMLCMLLITVIFRRCGSRIAWAWFGAVAILSLLMGPDKEAAAVFAALGYYPIIKPFFDGKKLKWIFKLCYFNIVILVLYWLLLHLFGLAELVKEFAEMGFWMTLATLILGNVTFVMLDRLLGMDLLRRRKRK